MADLIGKFRQMAVDYKTHDALVTFAIRADLGALEEEIKGYGDNDICIRISAYSPKRSLNANAYFHSLCREIGRKIEQSEGYVKNSMISQYGQTDLMENGERWIIKTNLDLSKMWEQENFHTKPLGGKEENGQQVFFYAVMRGSHTYTVKEMSQLIDGTVREAKELGIPTISDKDMERMLEFWGVLIERRKRIHEERVRSKGENRE